MLRPHRLAWILLLGLAGPVASCSNPKTIVFVQVQGTTTGIFQLAVKVRAGLLSTEIFVPGTPDQPITLPTDFTIEMDRSRRGALNLVVNARDQAKVVIATGSASLPAIVVGERNDITVTLGAAMPPPPDGGDVDAGADAGEDAGEPVDAGADDVEADGGVDDGPDDSVEVAEDGAVDTEDAVEAPGHEVTDNF
jgi:Ni,Fe-hydrogenase III small subunit